MEVYQFNLKHLMNIPNITLICIDCVNYEAAIRAINISTSKTEFSKVIFITDKHPENPPKSIEVKIIDKINSREEYSKFILNKLGDYFTTEHALIIQWDGYIINEKSWDPEFLNYDYIGAKWWHKDGLNVGNGGFSLRSKKLVECIKKLNIVTTNDTEDNIICRTYRRVLETRFGIKYADEKIADKFAYERGYTPINEMPWGFHGFYNIHRHVKKNELEEIINNLPTKSVLSSEFKELISNLHKISRNEECVMCCTKYLASNSNDLNILKLLYVSSIATRNYWVSAMAILQLSHKEPSNITFKDELKKFHMFY